MGQGVKPTTTEIKMYIPHLTRCFQFQFQVKNKGGKKKETTEKKKSFILIFSEEKTDKGK